ncbi:uncharacterized protein LOC120682188 isoform X2 [Panicum virgatum]|uniref:Uncharacterized protein n=1 Tax=Panicum virgatum TaxID=38727 RepID=A0A8T0Q2Z2_PANVG|nr:uncharacterized protein LOC120682188 isoform X2 [Panicum virgatum]KAG2567715.1 hypothetical protein PVAP13_7NG263700 [Panicum virgatum]
MPPPGKPYTRSAAAAAAPEADEVDPDYLFFLHHVRLDGDAYALYIPSKDGASPPEVIRYEQPLPGSNVGDPVTGSEYGGQGAPSPSEGDSLVARNSPHAAPYGAASPLSSGGKRKAPEPSPRVEARSGAVPMEEDPAAPALEPAWYDSLLGIDESYRLFLRHVHVVNDGTAVLKMGNLTVHLGDDPAVDKSDAGEDQGESILASGHSGEDTVGTEEEENVEGEQEAGHGSDLQIVNVVDSDVKEEEVSEEEEGEEDTQEDKVDEEGEDWEAEALDSSGKMVEGEGKEVVPGSDLQIVNVLEFEYMEEDDGEMLSAPIKGITESQSCNREASSSKCHPAKPHNASELQGVIWPPHIIERPNSVFKKNLMEILNKPFKLEEYDRYVALATNRSPIVKERRTRHNVVYYPWKHEMGKSYFDSYPDFAEQFRLQENNYPNRLALLRGFFFWLQNVGQEDQFRPWTDDFKGYRVVSFP